MLTCLAGRAGTRMSVLDWVDRHSEEPSAEPKPVIAPAGPLSFSFRHKHQPCLTFPEFVSTSGPKLGGLCYRSSRPPTPSTLLQDLEWSVFSFTLS